MMSDENAGPGREIRKSTLNVMLGGMWVPLGEAEILVEDGKPIKVISFTPKEFRAEEKDSEVPAGGRFLEDQREGADG